MTPIKMGFRLLATAVIASGMVACRGNHHNIFGQTATATASLGALVGANCTATSFNNQGAFSISGTTDGNGVANFVGIPANLEYLVTCTGGNYYDEATNSFKPNTGSLRSVGLPNQLAIGVTALTDLVADVLLRSGTTVNSGSIITVANNVASFFGLGNNSALLLAPPPVVNSAASLQAALNAGSTYAAVLAGISRLGDNCGTTGSAGGAAGALARFRADAQDNQLGGSNGCSRTQIDAAVDAAAAGTAAAAAIDANQGAAGRNTGSIGVTGGTGSGGG